ncbi:CpsD/CapB family tyrosine-protein kinase [Isoptericola sp. NPDC057191]|uniref:CpsD/CapB family tyrosine-protein kinase n=1 Tax=Isoptericola sp. NPDC057191 TaxID=3346041 RepID=UPI00363AF307
MSVRDVLGVVWVSRWLVLASVLLVVAGSLAYLERQEETYRSTTAVQLQSTRAASDDATEVTVATTPSDVVAPSVVKAAAADLGVPAATVEGSVTGSFGSEDGATILVTAEGSDPQATRVMADAVARAYAAHLVQLRDAQLGQLDDQRDSQRDQLVPVDKQLKKDPEDPLAAAERTTIVDQYQTLTEQMNTLRSLVVPGEIAQKASAGQPVGIPPAAVVALAVLGGLLVGVGLAFARRGVDVRVRGAHDAARTAASPVLAELADARRADRDARETGVLPVAGKRATPFTESVRELRTAVQVATDEHERVVVVVTSADSLAPRSFVAANLAASYALSGRRTIAVSGDLRRPQLDELLPAASGWSGDERQLRSTTVPNLSVFPVPQEDMDPADFLATDRARDLLERLRERAEVVVIDAPPVLAAADASILGRYATGVVLLAASGRTDRLVLAEAADRLRVNDVPLLGVALTLAAGDRRMRAATTYGDPPVARRARRRAGAAAASAADQESDAAPAEQPAPAAPRTRRDTSQAAEGDRSVAAGRR